jgi:hypothetical protein
MDSFEYMATIYEMYCNVCTKITKITSCQGRKRPEGAAEAHGASNPGNLTTRLARVVTTSSRFTAMSITGIGSECCRKLINNIFAHKC